MTKAELRNQYKQKRLELSANQKDKLEDLMLIRFQQLQLQIPQFIMTYSPIEKFNEFDPQLLTDYCLFKNPQQTLCYPVMDGETQLNCVAVNDSTVLKKNGYGIEQPVDGLLISPVEIDLVLIPLLAFDEAGHRVGYGKGYYDRYLEQCRKDVIRVGCSFFEAVEIISDTNQSDVKLDYCVTPEKCYTF